jgi:hypothetical protein
VSDADQAERVSLEWRADSPPDIARAELLDLYKLLIEEYRFQVKINSDRTQNYLTLNIAIITVAAGLLRFGGSDARLLVGCILLAGIFIARIAAEAVAQGHSYYRAIVYKKTLAESLLGRHRRVAGYDYEGATLAVETTLGMASQREILQDAKAWLNRPVTRGTITSGLIAVFRLFIVVDVLGCLYVGTLFVMERL